MVKVVHEASPVHQRREFREVPADPGVETGQLGGGGVVQARDLPVRKVATKQDVWETLNLHFSREVQVWQKKEMFLKLTGQARLVPLPGLPCCLHGDLDEDDHPHGDVDLDELPLGPTPTYFQLPDFQLSYF